MCSSASGDLRLRWRDSPIDGNPMLGMASKLRGVTLVALVCLRGVIEDLEEKRMRAARTGDFLFFELGDELGGPAGGPVQRARARETLAPRSLGA